MREIECPYCEKDNEYDTEQNAEDVPHQMECRECEKTFVFYVSYCPSFSSCKADCLNGAPHQWEDMLRGDEYMLEHYENCWLIFANRI